MNIRKASSGFFATAALALLTAGAAMAQNRTIAEITGVTPTVTDLTFTSNGAGGGTLVSTGGVTVTAVGPIGGPGDTFASLFSFGPITQTGPAQTVLGTIIAPFSNGSFTLTGGPTGTLLTGTFANSVLTSSSGSSGSVQNLGLNSVTYTGGLFYTEFLALYGGVPPVVGTFALSLSSITPPISILPGGGLASFGAAANAGTFDATTRTAPVPEPGVVAFAAVNGLGMLGLMVRARRRNKYVA